MPASAVTASETFVEKVVVNKEELKKTIDAAKVIKDNIDNYTGTEDEKNAFLEALIKVEEIYAKENATHTYR